MQSITIFLYIGCFMLWPQRSKSLKMRSNRLHLNNNYKENMLRKFQINSFNSHRAEVGHVLFDGLAWHPKAKVQLDSRLNFVSWRGENNTTRALIGGCVNR